MSASVPLSHAVPRTLGQACDLHKHLFVPRVPRPSCPTRNQTQAPKPDLSTKSTPDTPPRSTRTALSRASHESWDKPLTCTNTPNPALVPNRANLKTVAAQEDSRVPRLSPFGGATAWDARPPSHQTRLGRERPEHPNERKRKNMNFNPHSGTRTSTAWTAIVEFLNTNPDGASWITLKEVARTKSDLKGKTCQNLVQEAIRSGALVRTGRKVRLP